MAIIKLTKSGKGVLFIDDDGNSYIQSELYLRKLLDKEYQGFLLLTKLPEKVSLDRFKASPVLNRETGEKEEVTRRDDAFSEKRQAEKQEQKAYEDKW